MSFKFPDILDISGLFAFMWDRKRKIIWLLAGLVFGTIFLYPLAREESGRFDWGYFLQLEMLLMLVIVVMLYIYNRR